MKKGRPLIVFGIVLVLLSVGLLTFFQIRMNSSLKRNLRAAAELSELLSHRTAGVTGIYPNGKMPVLEIDGVDYVALLEIPAYGSCIAVEDRWQSGSTGRFCGSAYDGSLVLGGPDQPGSFDFCDDVDVGERLTVTDMTGMTFSYSVSRVDRSKHAQTPWLTAEEWDLTLFCHDEYAMEYIAVRCSLSGK